MARGYVWSPSPDGIPEGSRRPAGSTCKEEDDLLADEDDGIRVDADEYMSCSDGPEYDESEPRSEPRSSSPEADQDEGHKEKNATPTLRPRRMKDFPIQPNKVYIAGIPWATTEQQLEDYFKQYGDLQLIDLKRDSAGVLKGFGFVSFVDPKQVREVLKDRDRHWIQGKQFDCQACGTFGMKFFGPVERERVFVQGVPSSVVKEEVFDYFSKFGEVVEVIMQDDQIAVVTFKSSAAVQLALHAYNDHEIAGKWVQVKPMLRKVRGQRSQGDDGGQRRHSDYSGHGPGTSSSSTGGKPVAAAAPWRQGGVRSRFEWPRPAAGPPEDVVVERNKIFVGGLAPRGSLAAVQETELHEYFQYYGRILKIIMKTGFGFVTFETEHPVRKILEHFDTHEVAGRWIECRAFGRFGVDPGAPTSKKSIFVGGLSRNDVTAGDLEDYFSKFGAVDFVDLRQGRRSAVVVFKSGSGVQLALWSSGDGQTLNGNVLEIQPCLDSRAAAKGDRGGGKGHTPWSNDDSSASWGDKAAGKGHRSWSNDDSGARMALPWESKKRPRPWEAEEQQPPRAAPWKERRSDGWEPGGHDGAAAATLEPEKIFVTGLPRYVSDDELNDYFGKYGVVKDLNIKRDDGGCCKGFGFVSLASEKQVRAVLMDYDEHRLGGKYIECMACGKFGMAARAAPDKKRIFVGGTSGMASESLEWHFSQYGATERVEMEKRHALVTFRSGAGVQLALHAYHNHSVEGRRVEVRPALLKDGKSTDGGGGDEHGSKQGDYGGRGAEGRGGEPWGSGQQDRAQSHGWHQDRHQDRHEDRREDKFCWDWKQKQGQSWDHGAGSSSGQWRSRPY